MANAYMTTADVLKFNDTDMDLVVSDVLNNSPLLAAGGLAAVTAKGIDFKYTREDAAPGIAFRSPNVGIENQTGTLSQVSVDLKYLDASTFLDVAVAKANDKGAEFAVAENALRHMRAAMFGVESQVINGTSASAAGFEGFSDSSLLAASGDAQVVVAQGSGGVSSDGSSVYFIHSGPEGVELIWGEGGVMSVGDTEIRPHYNANKHFNAYHTPIEGWCGLKLGTKYSVARIANLNDSAPLTDDLLAQAYEKFPMFLKPTHIVMSRRSLSQLQQGRTSYHPLGMPSVRPQDWEGIPIVVSEAISNAEAGI